MRILLPLLVMCLSACAGLSPAERTYSAQQLATQAGWQSEAIATGRFRLMSMHPVPKPVETLAIFIEGDGMAWIDTYTPSTDPTPRTPIGLQLALAETISTAAYLGRPCQYDPDGTPQRCRSNDWTNARFSAEIVEAMNTAVTQLKRQFRAQKLMLVGYSGGATIAALLATRRDDVVQLTTVAGLLDHASWVQEMRVSPLTGSLNPADEWSRLKQVPQIHYIGGKDRQTGWAGMGELLKQAPATVRVVEMPDFTHTCCWVEAWPRLSQDRRSRL